MKALVVGGGGPTGPHIVEGLRQRGYQVAVLNRGVHPVPLPDDVERIVGDPHFPEPLAAALAGREFDVAVGSYGRLALVAEALAGRAGHFIGVGGYVAYRGFYQPEANRPSGLPNPTPESAPLVTDQAEHRFSALVAAAETAVFRHHPGATLFRYPYVYGPRQLVPREWSVVRRVLDGRRSIVVVHGGLGLHQAGYAENLAHAVLLAVDQPGKAAGRTYNCGDEAQLDLRQMIEVAADTLGVSLDLVSLPDTPAARAVALQPMAHHKLMDIHALRMELGYRDRVPAVEAVARTVRWYADNPPERGGEIEQRMFDRFDYAAEDQMIALYRDFVAKVDAVETTAVDHSHPYAHPQKAGTSRDHRGR
jgi:nucleoside-diphosphate-sugar epimerase